MMKTAAAVLALSSLVLFSCASYRSSADSDIETVGRVDVGVSPWLGGSDTSISRPDDGGGAVGEAEAASKGEALEGDGGVEFRR